MGDALAQVSGLREIIGRSLLIWGGVRGEGFRGEDEAVMALPRARSRRGRWLRRTPPSLRLGLDALDARPDGGLVAEVAALERRDGVRLGDGLLGVVELVH